MKRIKLFYLALVFIAGTAIGQTYNWENPGLPMVNPPNQSQPVRDLLVFKDRLIVCARKNVYYTNDGTIWTAATGLLTGGAVGNPIVEARHITVWNDTLIASVLNNRFYFSIDTGASWSEIPNSQISSGTSSGLYAFDDFLLMANDYYPPYIRYSTDGIVWNSSTINGTLGSASSNRTFLRPIVKFNGAHYGLANLRSNASYYQIYKSTDKGASWNELSPAGITAASSFWSGLSVFRDSLYLIAGNYPKIYKSSDGQNFEDAGISASFTYIKPLTPYMVFAHGPSISTDGTNWISLPPSNSAMMPVSQNTFDAVFYKGYLYTSSEGFGLFRLNLSGIVSVNETSTSKPSYSVFPNPSNGQFTIQSSQANTRYEVLDITGKLLHTLNVNSTYETIDLNLPQGLYFLREVQSGVSQKLLIQN